MIYTSVRIVSGFFLLGVGAVGFLVPILPGWPFFFVGLALLARHFHWARCAEDAAHRWRRAAMARLHRK